MMTMNTTATSGTSFALHQISSILCMALRFAIKYRHDRSEILYDLAPPSSSFSDAAVASSTRKSDHWTSGSEILHVIMNQLKFIHQSSSSLSSKTSLVSGSDSTTTTPFAEYRNIKVHVDVLAEVLLNGFYDKLTRSKNENEEQLYDEAKKLAIPLVRAYGRKEDDTDEKRALKMSLIHAYFDGIVNICHDNHHRCHRGRKSGAPSDNDDDKNPYDLYPMLSSPLEDDPSGLYTAVNQAVDFGSKLTFRRFVLRWYTDRGLYANVLDLGAVCPDVLAQCLEEDGRLREYRWIHFVRTGDYQGATSCLVGLGSGGNDLSVEENKLLLSLGKIASKIAKADEDGSMDDGKKTLEERIIDNNLTLIHAQEMLRDSATMMEHDDLRKFEHAIPANELLQIAIDQGMAVNNVEEKVGCLVVGLAIAETIQDRSPNEGAWSAAQVWINSIVSDTETWKNLANGDRSLISDEERRRFIAGTVFYEVASQYYGSKREPNLDIGFLNNRAVKEQIVAKLSLDQQTVALLVAAAEHAVEDVMG
mmetsp:Transcript_15258/g.22646  ORF Transcript_15258/g.22646 Transcript_15258/m.22646 type:complete len:533 (-) Transcript_15258:232-1830(-)